MGIYNLMFYGGLILAVIFLITAVVLFFVLKIPDALGVVTGRTQKKAIEEIRSGGSVSGSKKKRRMSQLSTIQTRDVDVKVTKGTGTITKETGSIPSGTFKDEKRSSDASAGLAEKAMRDAKATMENQAKKDREALDTDETEVLTYQEAKRDKSEDTTTILENEQATDVLTSDAGMYDDDEAATDVLSSDADSGTNDRSYDEEATDVLKSTAAAPAASEEEDVTDVLRGPSALHESEEAGYEEDATDVLTADVSDLDESEIYGTYNPEMTAVLRSDMTPNESSVEQTKKGLNQPGITVIYNETIVHTDESL